MSPDAQSLPGLLLRPVEALLNRGVRQSATAQGIARELEGRAVEVALDGTAIRVRLGMVNGAIVLSASAPDEADASISGTPTGLARLLGPGAQDAVRQGHARLTGDTELAERFRKLLVYARPDLEEELARLVGDPLAHSVGRFVGEFSAWSGQALASLERSVAEYLQEESRLVPTRRELSAFAAGVDELVNDVARAEAALRDAQAKLRGPGSPPRA
jgi:ubiquinone biosynthesis protein UbiJ